MDEKNYQLRKGIMVVIEDALFDSEGDSVIGCITNSLLQKFHIIPKEKVTISSGINGKTILEIEPWDFNL